ncbi:TonB-dependent receptor domain-containing protein [Sphingomonas arantia]|uniref:TonB-dependent receptor domain-containing protein n=1 Tax=Sphingomonas arantia TaxID=1460676 RepID=A0ABW4TYK3_9SPHN
MIARRACLLAGTAILAMSGTAHAVAAPADTAIATATADVPADAAAADPADGAEIVVLGFGQARSVQTITARDIAVLTPGTTPLKAIAKLPGVNFQAADAFGAYEWSSRISIRGFNQNQLGFTLDGVPLGDMSYGNSNGLHISRALISENIGATSVAQGAGALGTASTGNLGGTIMFESRDPSNDLDLAASGTYGSDATYRGFVRLDSGDLTGNGLKGYVSYGYLKTDKWKGFGEQRQHQANVKLVQDLGDRGSLTGFFNFSDRREQDYQDLSLDMIDRLGLKTDNISNDFPLATRLAQIYQNQATRAGSATAALPYPTVGLTFPAPYETVDDAYFDAAGLRRDYLGGATFDGKLTDALSVKLTGYFHNNHGQGLWFLPYTPTPGGSALSVRSTEYDMTRGGALGHVAWEAGPNRLEVGGWYESNAFRNARRFYGLADQATPSRDALSFQSNPFATQFDVKFDTTTAMYYVSDRLELGALTLNGGWKGYKVTNRAKQLVGNLASGTIDAKDYFLPQAGAVYALGGSTELFATFTQNMRAFTSAAVGGSPFATTQVGFDLIRDTLKPEKSDSYEVGGRFRAAGFQASAAAYYVDFTNRLLSLVNGVASVGNPTTLQNVGDVRNYGFEATALYKVIPAVSLFASYSYNKSEFRDDVLNTNGTVNTATAGKTVPDSPRHMVKGEIVYNDDRFLARIGADYMSRRFFTYENDQSVAGRVLLDATIGYTFATTGPLKGFAIEGSVTNLTDKNYVSTVGSNGFGARGDNQTLLAGAPRQFFVTLRRGF